MRQISVASVHVDVEYWGPMLLTLNPHEKRLLHSHCKRKVNKKAGGNTRCGETNCIHLPAVLAPKKIHICYCTVLNPRSLSINIHSHENNQILAPLQLRPSISQYLCCLRYSPICFTFPEPCVVIQLCEKDQQDARFCLIIYSN
jgi:hypothetical protein